MRDKIIEIIKEYSDSDYNDGNEIYLHRDCDIGYIADEIIKLLIPKEPSYSKSINECTCKQYHYGESIDGVKYKCKSCGGVIVDKEYKSIRNY